MSLIEMYALHGAQLVADRFGLTIEEALSLDKEDAIEKAMTLLEELDAK